VKLDIDSVHRLDLLVTTAQLAGIDRLIIEPDQIRGIDMKQNVAILTDKNVPDFNGKTIGINRASVLGARLALVKATGDPMIEATESTHNPNDIAIMEISSGKSKAQFRCASSEAIKGVPKKINDVLVWKLTIEAKLIPTLTQAAGAMSADLVTIASSDGKVVSFEFVDANKDVFSTEAEDDAQWIGTGAPATSFCQKYPAKTLISLLKEASKGGSVTVSMGEGGVLALTVNGFQLYVIPPQ
jgi:hypothetical protein